MLQICSCCVAVHTGLDAAAIDDILLQPAALIGDPSWFISYILSETDDNGDEEEEEQEGSSSADGVTGQQQQQRYKSIHDMSMLELAKVGWLLVLWWVRSGSVFG